jgi:hypothetical protein
LSIIIIKKENIVNKLNEIGDAKVAPFQYQLKNRSEDSEREFILMYTFKTSTDFVYDVSFGVWNDLVGISFKANNSWEVVNTGEVFRVMATIVAITKDVISENPFITKIMFDPTKRSDDDKARERLYMSYIKQQIPNSTVGKSGNSIIVNLNNENMSESMDKVKGGLADGKTINDLVMHHGVESWASIQFESLEKQLKLQLEKGMKIESEHTSDSAIAREIAIDHLWEDPKYYDKLEKIEESTQRQFIRKLVKENIELSIVDETPDSNTFDIYYKKRKAGHITFGPAPESLGENTHQILNLYLEDDYTNLNVATQAVKSIWTVCTKCNRLVVSLPSKSRLLLENMGLQRLNDSFHMLMRGHG